MNAGRPAGRPDLRDDEREPQTSGDVVQSPPVQVGLLLLLLLIGLLVLWVVWTLVAAAG